MNKLVWHNGSKQETDKFSPYLMQVLETHGYVRPQRRTAEAAREALLAKTPADQQLRAGFPKVVGQYIDDLVGWHYMGAAEYEWGAIPGALEYLRAHRNELTAAVITVPGSELPRNFTRGNINYDPRAQELDKLRKSKKQDEPTKARGADLEAALKAQPGDLTLYYLGPAEYVEHIQPLVARMCKGEQRNKNGNCFSAVADPVSSHDRAIGWCCLDYPFFLVKDKAVFIALDNLFTGSTP